MKTCTSCGEVKDFSCFHTHPRTRDGYRGKCKPCKSAYSKEWHAKNRDRILAQQTAYRQAHRDEIVKKIVASQRERRARDPMYKFHMALRRRTLYAFHNVGLQKSERTMELVGCTTEQLREHLVSLFKPGMTLENHGSYWHIDHIRPVASFDLSDPEQVKQCFHYTNLQPLTATENLKKGARV